MPNTRNMKETTSRHKIITLLKTRDEKENLENSRRKKAIV